MTLANGWENAKVDVAVVREQAEHEDVHQPEHRERRRPPASGATD